MRHVVVTLALVVGASCAGTETRSDGPGPSAGEGGAPAAEAPAPSGFFYAIEDVFHIAGRGTVVTGKIDRGVVKVGDELELVRAEGGRKVTVTGLEKFRTIVDQAGPGEVVGVLLRGVARDEVTRGDVLATSGTVRAHASLEASITLVAASEGGRKTPIAPGYRPQVVVHTASTTGTVTLPPGKDALAPGESAVVTITLTPAVALEVGMSFALREGGRTVGTGKVTALGR